MEEIARYLDKKFCPWYGGVDPLNLDAATAIMKIPGFKKDVPTSRAIEIILSRLILDKETVRILKMHLTTQREIESSK